MDPFDFDWVFWPRDTSHYTTRPVRVLATQRMRSLMRIGDAGRSKTIPIGAK